MPKIIYVLALCALAVYTWGCKKVNILDHNESQSSLELVKDRWLSTNLAILSKIETNEPISKDWVEKQILSNIACEASYEYAGVRSMSFHALDSAKRLAKYDYFSKEQMDDPLGIASYLAKYPTKGSMDYTVHSKATASPEVYSAFVIWFKEKITEAN